MPSEQRPIRKLRAILSADVKGYSLLMAGDETFSNHPVLTANLTEIVAVPLKKKPYKPF